MLHKTATSFHLALPSPQIYYIFTFKIFIAYFFQLKVELHEVLSDLFSIVFPRMEKVCSCAQTYF